MVGKVCCINQGTSGLQEKLPEEKKPFDIELE
jgi:hypothetical protein